MTWTTNFHKFETSFREYMAMPYLDVWASPKSYETLSEFNGEIQVEVNSQERTYSTLCVYLFTALELNCKHFTNFIFTFINAHSAHLLADITGWFPWQ